ncbi:hypothetical protein Pfo_013924 [Paulownia fortunei]|nr:hypothetical protein Pfo_013924 [Paulownia fortunei]
MKRTCELCKRMARMHCDSDQASLCWNCDAKVHSANFLVARHSRILLCHVCQSPTPWSASGAKLGPTVFVCQQCINEEICDESGEEDEEQAAEEEEEYDKEMGENQVVPWSPPPPAAESSSSSEEPVSGNEVVVSRKRYRLDDASSNQLSDDDHDCSSPHLNIYTPLSDSAVEVAGVTESLSRRITTPLQKIRRTDPGQVGVSESGILESLRKFHRQEMSSGAEMTELCMLSIDLNSSDSS